MAFQEFSKNSLNILIITIIYTSFILSFPSFQSVISCLYLNETQSGPSGISVKTPPLFINGSSL